MTIPGNLSGKDWWYANQARYPNSRDVGDLDGDFQERVRRFIRALRAAGATVAIGSTRRNAIRAHLMHYSWQIATGALDPAQIPAKPGLSIEWDHGNLERSRAAAQEMVDLFHMAHIASLHSNHIVGKAIDITITWRGQLVISGATASPLCIDSIPRNGTRNRDLHEVGADVFGVIKLQSDPPHWSYNGR